MAPIIQLTMLGYAATTDVRDVPMVVVDEDRSAASRELVERFEASEKFVIVDTVSSLAEIDGYLDRGDAWMALAIPAGYGERVRTGRPAADPGRGGWHRCQLDERGARLCPRAGQRRTRASSQRPRAAARRAGSSAPTSASGSTQASRAGVFMIPGILALVLLVVTTNLSSMAIVREKELGTLEQLNVTPLARWELIVGKLVPYAILGMVDALLVVAVAVGWFEIPLRGSLALLLVMCLVYLLSTLGLGPLRLDDLANAAAGDDDDVVLLPAADGLSLGVHLPDREHAGRRFSRSRI